MAQRDDFSANPRAKAALQAALPVVQMVLELDVATARGLASRLAWELRQIEASGAPESRVIEIPLLVDDQRKAR